MSGKNNIQNRENGQNRSFEKVYYDHIDALFNYGKILCNDKALVDDCIQDLFADIWEKWDSLGEIISLRSYLLGALRRKILRKIYSQKNIQFTEEVKEKDLQQFLDEKSADTGEQVEKYLARLKEALPRLTAKQQEILYLRFYNKLTFKEIALVLNVQTRSVYKTAKRAVELLRQHIMNPTLILQLLLVYFF